MTMYKRQQVIIAMMNDMNEWITGKELGRRLHVSDRTIRSDMDMINKHYEKTLIISDQHHGYSLDKALFRTCETPQEYTIPQTPEERSIYILQKLLFQKSKVNLTSMQDEVFVSGYSIENDLKRIRVIIEKYEDVTLVRSKNYIHLAGSEKNKRRLYKDLLEKEAKGNFLNMDKLATLYKEFDFLEVKHLLDETIEEYHFKMREMTMPMLMMHIGISIERIIHHNYVQTEVKSELLKNSIEYQIAVQFFQKVSRKIRIEVVEDEVIRLSLLLMGKRSSEFKGSVIYVKHQEVYISTILEELLLYLYEEFDVDVRKDTDLQLGLEMHLQSLFERQRQGVHVDNVYLQEIKKKYPLIFEMGIRAGEFLNDRVDLNINENELGFLSLHLGAAYERSRQSEKHRVLMIFPDDQALRKVCIQKIEQRFSQRMEIIDHMSVFEEKRVLELHPDLILSTLPLAHSLQIMSEQISLFVNNEDEGTIFYALNDLDKLKSRSDFQNLIKDMIRPELYFYEQEAQQPKDIIHTMCDVMYREQLVPLEFKDSVLQREEISSTSFIFGFAIPHALHIPAKRSCLSIAILKQSILWGEFDVQLILLIGVKEDDKNLMRIFFDWLSNVVSDSNKFTALLQAKNYQEFIQQVLED